MTEVVAEFTTNHAGHLGLLLRMVDKAVEAGATSIKMQKKDVDRFYSLEKLTTRYASPYGKTYRDYRTMFELDRYDWRRFDEHCRERGIRWFCTVQDLDSLHFMLAYGSYRYKVASSNARNGPFLEAVARLVPEHCEIVVSLAGCSLHDIDHVVATFSEHRRLWLLHCVAEYPCPPERLRLGNIERLLNRFGCERVRIGYSGHEEGSLPSAAAVWLGAEMVERHFCLSRYSFVHHVECSLEPDELAIFVKRAQAVSQMRENGDEVGDLCSWSGLPSAAFGTEFGMAEEEKPFLEDQTYGRDYLGTESQFGGGVRPR